MPKGKKTNKSQAIRDLLTAKPEMTVKEVLAALANRGLKVTDNLVYFIKGKMKAKTQRRKRVVRALGESRSPRPDSRAAGRKSRKLSDSLNWPYTRVNG